MSVYYKKFSFKAYHKLGGYVRYVASNPIKLGEINEINFIPEYEIDGKWYSEEEFQRILKMKSFL